VTYGFGDPTDHGGYTDRDGYTIPDGRYGGIATRDNDPWLPVRIEVGYRVREMSQNHVRRATFERVDSRLPGPHALAWLYAAANDETQVRRYTIDTASRMFPWTDDVRPEHNVKDAGVLVQQMVKIAQQNLATAQVDPLQYTDRSAPLPAHAEFVGVALSSLGMPGMDWSALKPGGFGFGVELPAECVVRMVDGTWLELTRRGRVDWKMECNKAMGYMNAMDWAWRPTMPEEWQPRPGSVHEYLHQLMVLTDRTYAEGNRQQTERARTGRR